MNLPPLKFSAKTQIVVSDDFAASIPEICLAESVRRVGIVLDPHLARQPAAARLQEVLAGRGLAVQAETAPGPEPTTEMVDAMAARFRASPPDLLVGLGGGSTLDLAKAVSVMAVNEGSVTDYHGTAKALVRGIRKIMVPTTAGTGSEVTPGAVLVNPKTAFKRALGGPLVCPDYAVLDARLTLTMPQGVAVATGMDALAHAVESFTARCANPVTRMYSREAFRLVANHLPRAISHPDDLEARRHVLLGSCLAGYAIFNSNTGAAHAMAYPMGIYHHVPHGVAVALLLPKVVAHNVRAGCRSYADLLALVQGVSLTGDGARDAAAFATWLAAYAPLQKLGTSLGTYGINAANRGFLAQRGLDLASALSNNPVDFTGEDALAVLTALTD
jgi:alcohol dehydrogenase class IV